MMKLDKISWQYYKSKEVVLDNISNINYARARLITSIFLSRLIFCILLNFFLARAPFFHLELCVGVKFYPPHTHTQRRRRVNEQTTDARAKVILVQVI